jgi:hypothetical protein
MTANLKSHSNRRQVGLKMSERLYCVFSLSKEDVFGKVNHVVWLEDKKHGEKPYYFRTGKPKRLPSGSKVLFSFEGKIFGEATVKEDVKELSAEEKRQARERDGFDYKYSMVLDNSSISIFKKHPTKKDVTMKIGKKFGRLFTYLNAVEYQQILRMAEE